MRKRIKELEREISKLSKALANSQAEMENLRLISDRDFLTGLYNRKGFIGEAGKFLTLMDAPFKKERRQFVIKNFSLIFIDLDNLKQINDLYGHKAGDKFLKATADIFKSCLRDMDIAARWGGDEFVIGLLNVDEKSACKIANKIKRMMLKIKITGVSSKVRYGASFGVISAKSKKHKLISNLYELIEKADNTMYKAKKTKGKSFIAVFC